MNPIKWFFSQIKHYWSGKGNPLILIVFWWALLNVASFFIGMMLMGTQEGSEDLIIVIILNFIVGSAGLVITFVYPVILAVSWWRCAFNVKKRWIGYIIRVLIFPAMFLQLQMCSVYLVGAFFLLVTSIERIFT